MSDTEATATTEETPKKERKPKDRPEVTYFITDRYADPSTVYGALRVIVAEYGAEGCPSSVLLKRMMEGYRPKKSQKFGESYVNSYMRDAPKRGFLTTDPEKRSDTLGEPTIRVRKAAEGVKKPTGVIPSEAGLKFIENMMNHLSIPEFSESNPGAKMEDLAKAWEKPVVSLQRVLGGLMKKGLVVEENGVISLTKTAYDSLEAAREFYAKRAESKETEKAA
jgi:hypothetical protein